MTFNKLTAEEAASFITNNCNVGLSGFTAPGVPKVVPETVAAHALAEHEAGREFKINIFSGASTGDHCDGILARNNAVGRRTPYQNHPDLRKRINAHDAHYFDLHLSELAQKMRYGFYGDIDVAVIEVQDIDENGEAVLGLGVGNAPTWVKMAKKIIIERNHHLPAGLRGVHDIFVPNDPPYRGEIPIFKASDRAGSPLLKIDPSKIVGVVETNAPEGVKSFSAPDETTLKIGANVCNFLAAEMHAGRIPSTFLPLQSGVGNVANAVLYGLAENLDIPPFEMYSEVLQDAVADLLLKGRCKFASASSLTMTDETLDTVFANMDVLRDKIILRPSEISNNPEVIRRLGVIAMNTALEADIFGNINSTHVTGIRMMNGIGGSGDFTRNAYLSIFSCPSITKGGLISNIVPMVSHVDHSEHSVDILITEQGVADLRGLDPVQRAHTIIDNCAHPMYRELLRDYLKIGRAGQTPHNLHASLGFHTAFIEHGDMSKVDWSVYAK